jgi:hypothetical protein
LHVDVGAPKHDPPFSILSNGGATTIPPNSSEKVIVQYAPTAKGTTNDQLSITSDDPKQKKAIHVSMKGKSKAPRHWVATFPELSLAPARRPSSASARLPA